MSAKGPERGRAHSRLAFHHFRTTGANIDREHTYNENYANNLGRDQEAT